MITYRLARADDWKIWIQLNREFMEEETQDSTLWSNIDKGGDQIFKETFAEALSSPELITIMLFEENDQTVGFANLAMFFSVWSYGKALIIDDLYMRTECRGKGYGKEVMGIIEEYAREKGCKRLQFQTEFTNQEAMGFYDTLGYVSTDMKFYFKYLNKPIVEYTNMTGLERTMRNAEREIEKELG